MRLALAFLLIALAGCSGGLAVPSGAVFAFNPSQWQPTPGDLAVPKAAP